MIEHINPKEEHHRFKSSLRRGHKMLTGMGKPGHPWLRGGQEGREGALGTWGLKATL